MLLILLTSGLALVALPGVARPAGRRLHPAEWARLSVTAVGAGALLVEVGAIMYAAPTLARASGIAALAALCERMLGDLTPGGPVAGWVATAVAVMLPPLGHIGGMRARRTVREARIERCLGEHRHLGPHELVVLPTTHPVAVSVPSIAGRGRDQIVTSEGLVDILSTDELAAVLCHEAAYLRHRHHRYLLVAVAVEHAFAWFPPARRSTAALRLALERWADEQAAADGPGRLVVRDALLAVTASLVAEPAVAAFSAAETIGERLGALDSDAPRPGVALHIALYSPGTVLGILAVAALWSWAAGTERVLSMAGTCLS